MENGSRIEELLELALRKLPDHDISGALQTLDEASEIQPDNVEICNLKANCYYLLGDFAKAKYTWEKVLEFDSNNKTALSKLEKFESPSFQFWLKRYNHALESIRNKKYSEALVNLQNLIKENDGFVSLYQLLGLTYLALNDEKNAVKVWQQGLKLDINNEQILKYLNSPKKSNKRKQGISKVSTDNSNSSGIKSNTLYIITGMFVMLFLLQMSITLNSDKGYKDTIQSLQKKINVLSEKLAHSESEPVITVATSHNKMEDEKLSNERSSYNIEYENEYYSKGYKAYLSRDFKTAISNLSVVVSISSHSYINREALYYLARTYYVSKDYDNAEKYYLRYLEEFPNTNYTDDSMFYLGCVYYLKGDMNKAQEMLNLLNTIDPQSGYRSTDLYKKIMK